MTRSLLQLMLKVIIARCIAKFTSQKLHLSMSIETSFNLSKSPYIDRYETQVHLENYKEVKDLNFLNGNIMKQLAEVARNVEVQGPKKKTISQKSVKK